MRKQLVASLLLVLALLTVPVCEALADPADVTILYSPGINLEAEDIRLIGSARSTIDMAAYALTSFTITDALADAGRRGVRIRLLLDARQLRSTRDSVLDRLEQLGRIQLVSIRVSVGRDPMHLKSYSVDDTILRSGSANFSPSGLKPQNRNLLMMRDREKAILCKVMFREMFVRSRPFTRQDGSYHGAEPEKREGLRAFINPGHG